ncbi:anti-sigma B factor antagonist [Murinocardiopsis flavida]|uniref:Anti-sigma factor antagonist n=1 Tax=Murinocardiopsis flavida TaxID=645275 RepID=A0A2P8DMZ8_9ACTN|nr:STAS domain-containing protein [Murinocardiopsis flavida]PSK98575.1 anti-sigma B factor antagonist [Murinocardiopsis flavida]
MTSKFQIATRTEAGVVVVVPEGDLDAMTSSRFSAVLDSVFASAEPMRGVVVDMSGVGFCDSRCIGALVASYRQARDLGVGLIIAAPQRTVHRLFTIAGIDQVMTVEDDLQRAVKLVREQ